MHSTTSRLRRELGMEWSDIINSTNETCLSSVPGNCTLNDTETLKRTVIATIRMFASLLSIFGSLTIIVSIVVKKQVTTPKLLPLFVLSIADCLMSMMWVIAAIFWYTDIHPTYWCFLASLPTVILECVTINLALVFALAAFSLLKKTDVGQLLDDPRTQPQLWTPSQIFVTYFLVWTIPTVVIMAVFGTISGVYGMAAQVNDCACWCLPYFGNIVPLNNPYTKPRALFFRHTRILVTSFGTIVGTNYLVVFVALLVIYIKILRHIRRMKITNNVTRSHNYGAINTMLEVGESKAKRRITLFLLVFLITGFFNFVLSYAFVISNAVEIRDGLRIDDFEDGVKDNINAGELVVYLLQSVTMPLQGLFNAVVYGWTRGQFREVIRRPSQSHSISIMTQQEKEEEAESMLQSKNMEESENNSYVM